MTKKVTKKKLPQKSHNKLHHQKDLRSPEKVISKENLKLKFYILTKENL